MKLHLKNITDQAEWDTLLRPLPNAHILQSWQWGDFKHATTGWQPHRWAFYDADERPVALVSMGIRKIAGIFPLMYAPKAPIFLRHDETTYHAVLKALEVQARQARAVWLKIDPDIALATGEPNTSEDTPNPDGVTFQRLLTTRGWRFSPHQIQFRNTIHIALTPSEDDLLSAMSQNTRRKVRQADKKGVTVRPATAQELDLLYDLYKETSDRDGFLIRPRAYYIQLWRDFIQADLAHALIAEAEGRPIAHVILLHYGHTCWYFYGASSNEGRERMPNYALQWHAMQWAKARGYTTYDMWGAPDEFDESDGMWGVYAFKRGFRGKVVRHVGAWDYAPHPWLYDIYMRGIPAVRSLMRRLIGK